MKVADAKKQFIQDWGILANAWGIHRTMGQVHALLLTATKPLSSDEIIEALSISRGNCNMTVRDLLQWGLANKTTVPGERREYFQGEKDMWKVAQIIARERKRRELDPLTAALAKYGKIDGPKEETQDFRALIDNIQSISDIASKSLDLLSRSGLMGFLKTLK